MSRLKCDENVIFNTIMQLSVIISHCQTRMRSTSSKMNTEINTLVAKGSVPSNIISAWVCEGNATV